MLRGDCEESRQRNIPRHIVFLDWWDLVDGRDTRIPTRCLGDLLNSFKDFPSTFPPFLLTRRSPHIIKTLYRLFPKKKKTQNSARPFKNS